MNRFPPHAERVSADRLARLFVKSAQRICLRMMPLLLVACGADAPPDPALAIPAAIEPPPVLEATTFAAAGETLTLFPDGTFRQRSVHDGSDEVFHDLGRWSRDGDPPDRLTLDGGKEAPQRLRFIDADHLRVLNNAGEEIVGRPLIDLIRQEAVDPIAGPMRLTGLYTYMADAAVLRECLTGERFPVLIEADHLAVERAYLAARDEPGQALFLTLDAEFVMRAPEPGMPEREHLRVTRFDRFHPDQRCPGDAP